jgi:hypothetical protein
VTKENEVIRVAIEELLTSLRAGVDELKDRISEQHLERLREYVVELEVLRAHPDREQFDVLLADVNKILMEIGRAR